MFSALRLNTILGIMLFGIFFMGTAQAAEGIKWYSYDEAMALTKSEKKKVYINFYTDWCGYCRKMEKKTFTDGNVIAYLNKNYLPVRVNAEKERSVAAKYKAFSFPDNTFITETGEYIGKQPGFLGPSDFLKMLTFVYEEKYKNKSK